MLKIFRRVFWGWLPSVPLNYRKQERPIETKYCNILSRTRPPMFGESTGLDSWRETANKSMWRCTLRGSATKIIGYLGQVMFFCLQFFRTAIKAELPRSDKSCTRGLRGRSDVMSLGPCKSTMHLGYYSDTLGGSHTVH